MYDLETSRKGRPWPAMGRSVTGQKVAVHVGLIAEVRKVFQKLKIGVIFQGGRLIRRDPGSSSKNTARYEAVFFFI
jgi:hypothetical protein